MSRISLIGLGPGNPLYWPTFKEHVASLIIEALLLLRQRNDLVKGEKTLNRLLYYCIQDANLKYHLPLPAYDAHNPPDPEDEQKAEREDNLPDFYWTLMDHQANNNCYRTFVLECKRLDKKSESSNWEYTEQYVIAGILRFFLEEKGYGKGCETGAMASYVQEMEFDTILSEINSHITAKESSIPKLVGPAEGWQPQRVNYLSHIYQRSYIPFNFFLQHFWIDMRDCQYLAPSGSENTSIDSDSSQSEEIEKSGKKKS
jgi:hypothetical protein